MIRTIRIFFKYFGIVYAIFFLCCVLSEGRTDNYKKTIPYVYLVEGNTLNSIYEILNLNKEACCIISLCEPYKYKESDTALTHNKTTLTWLIFDICVDAHIIHFAANNNGKYTEIYPTKVVPLQDESQKEAFLNKDLRMLLFHKSTLNKAEENLKRAFPTLQKHWYFPQKTDFWYLLFVVDPNWLCFFLHFMLLGNFLIMLILKKIEHKYA